MSLGTVVKMIDTQNLAKDKLIRGPISPYVGLKDLLGYFEIRIPNLHTAGNEAAGALIAAVLTAPRTISTRVGIRRRLFRVRMSRMWWIILWRWASLFHLHHGA